MAEFVDLKNTYHETDEGMIVERNQEVTDDFWKMLHEMRLDFHFRTDGLTPVALVPQEVVERWKKRGFDFDNASAKEIQAKLKAEAMEKFLVTEKKF